MKDLITLVLEKDILENFSHIYINAANSAKQIKLYVNIEDLSFIEIDELLESFEKLKRNKKANSEIILYSFSPIGEDVIGVLKYKKSKYLYCGEINNYSLTMLSVFKRITDTLPCVAINCEEENWFDYALWIIQYDIKIFFYNLKNVDSNLLIAFLMHKDIKVDNVVNYKTLENLLIKKSSIMDFISDNLIYVIGTKCYDYNHGFIGDLLKESLFNFLPEHKELQLSDKCEKCNLNKICYNFNIGIVDISTIGNCDTLRKMVSLIMLQNDKKEFSND